MNRLHILARLTSHIKSRTIDFSLARGDWKWRLLLPIIRILAGGAARYWIWQRRISAEAVEALEFPFTTFTRLFVGLSFAAFATFVCSLSLQLIDHPNHLVVTRVISGLAFLYGLWYTKKLEIKEIK